MNGQNPVTSGKGWLPAEVRRGQFPMAIVRLVAFENKLWSIGDKSVWTSADGVNWNSQPKTDWGARYGNVRLFSKTSFGCSAE